MAKRRKFKQTYSYDCTLTGESFTRTTKIKNTEDLVSVQGYYELHPEKEDRPEHIIKLITATAEVKADADAKAEEAAELLATPKS